MARWSPPLPQDGEHSLGHDAVALYLFVACVAATVALATSMCSACGRKPKAVSQEPDASTDSKSGAYPASDGVGNGENQEGGGTEEEVVKLSPELGTHGPIEPVAQPSSTSKRKLSVSLSKKVNMNIPDKMRLSRRERKDKDAPEDTLWKKAIILGEKCKIPGERDGAGDGADADADADEMAAGTFRRSSYSRPMSRSSSFAVHQQPLPEPPALRSAEA